MKRIKINKRNVNVLPLVESGRQIYLDTELPGFMVVVGKRSKTFYVQKDFHGKTKRKTLGKVGAIEATEARQTAKLVLWSPDHAKEFFGITTQGNGPSTLREALEDYLQIKKNLKQSTRNSYRVVVEQDMKDWLDIPLREITRSMIANLHTKLTERGPYLANRSIDVFQAIWNHVAIDDESLPGNPAYKFRKQGGRHKEHRRDAALRLEEIGPWSKALYELDSTLARHYLLLIYFTGLRRTEATTLQWDRINFEQMTLRIDKTKNGKPLTIPITRQVKSLLLEIQREKNVDSEWVFPSYGRTKHFTNPVASIAKIIKISGVKFHVHALRNTFITVARRHLGMDVELVKRLVNHAPSRDVTEGYASDFQLEQLREPAQRIADCLDSHLYRKPTDNVVSLNSQTA